MSWDLRLDHICNVFRRKWSFFQEFNIFADCFSTTIRYSNLVFLCFSWSTSVVFELKNLHQPYLMFRFHNLTHRLHEDLMKSPIIPYHDGKSTIYQRKWSKSWKILEIQDSVSLFSSVKLVQNLFFCKFWKCFRSFKLYFSCLEVYHLIYFMQISLIFENLDHLPYQGGIYDVSKNHPT